MTVTLKTAEDIAGMRVAGKLAADVLEMIAEHVKPGVTTEALDRICHDYIVDVQKAIPAPLNYKGFPKSICTSINHVVCHGIPGDKPLKDGDTLHVYQKGDGSYKIWTVADGQWVSPAAKFSLGADGNATSEPGTDPLTVPAGFGTGFWLIRSDVSKPFYIYGAAVDVASTEATAGAVNLMGNPLRKSAVATIDGAVAGDTIQIPTSTGLPKIYSCKNVGGKLQWTWWEGSEFRSSDNPPAFASGVGFWYTSKETAGKVTFSWL